MRCEFVLCSDLTLGRATRTHRGCCRMCECVFLCVCVWGGGIGDGAACGVRFRGGDLGGRSAARGAVQCCARGRSGVVGRRGGAGGASRSRRTRRQRGGASRSRRTRRPRGGAGARRERAIAAPVAPASLLCRRVAPASLLCRRYGPSPYQRYCRITGSCRRFGPTRGPRRRFGPTRGPRRRFGPTRGPRRVTRGRSSGRSGAAARAAAARRRYARAHGDMRCRMPASCDGCVRRIQPRAHGDMHFRMPASCDGCVRRIQPRAHGDMHCRMPASCDGCVCRIQPRAHGDMHFRMRGACQERLAAGQVAPPPRPPAKRPPSPQVRAWRYAFPHARPMRGVHIRARPRFATGAALATADAAARWRHDCFASRRGGSAVTRCSPPRAPAAAAPTAAVGPTRALAGVRCGCVRAWRYAFPYVWPV